MGSCNTWAPDDWTVDIEERVYTMMYLISCTMLVLPGDWFQKPTSSSSFLYQRTERLRSCFGSTRHSNIAGSPSATNTWGFFIFIVCSSFSIFFNISLHVFLLHSFFPPSFRVLPLTSYTCDLIANCGLWAFYLSFSFFEAFRCTGLLTSASLMFVMNRGGIASSSSVTVAVNWPWASFLS